jgi:hypothetical protein
MESNGEKSVTRDAAIAAATLIVEEFCPHCPNGIAEAVHERLREILQGAIEAADSVRRAVVNEPSLN